MPNAHLHDQVEFGDEEQGGSGGLSLDARTSRGT